MQRRGEMYALVLADPAKTRCHRILRWILCATLALVAFHLFSAEAGSQIVRGPGDEPEKIDDATKAAIIDSVAKALNDVYVFPDVARRMESEIKHNLRAKAYKDLETYEEFTQRITLDLYEIAKDRHLHVDYYTAQDFRSVDEDSLSAEEHRRMIEYMRRNNYGFHKLEHLPGNVGYLDLRAFNDARWAGETAIAAMKFLANCDAVIVDLRWNGGGSPSMIQLISSYFFEEPVHLNSFYIRDEDRMKQFWSHSYVEGPRMTEVDLYVLTSPRTFSAAEEFTYNMKNLERATIVGETTGGGAHPVRRVAFPDLKVSMSLPFGRAINPISGTNWEGTGIEPHIEVPESDALNVAHMEALKKLADAAPDDDRRKALDWDIRMLKAKVEPIELDPALAQRYAGAYGPRTLLCEDGEIYYKREERPKLKAIPISEDTFVFEEYDFFMLQVEMDEEGSPTALIGLYREGHTDRSPRSE
jgi:hypothetical protein